jgi:MFS family permease
MLQSGVFKSNATIALSFAGLIGFLVGALLGRSAGKLILPRRVLNAMNVSASASLFACGFPLSVPWFFWWRFLGGFSGGVVVVLLAPTVIPHISKEKKGLAGGAIFIGAGIGVLASGTIVPLLLRTNLRDTWLGLGLASSLFAILAWNNWPESPRSSRGTA